MNRKEQLLVVETARKELTAYFAQTAEISLGLDASLHEAADKLNKRSPIAYAALVYANEAVRVTARTLGLKMPEDAFIIRQMKETGAATFLENVEKALK